jgi:16S rRNA U516 pseudouridylate synthase RsuA-like enzyme
VDALRRVRIGSLRLPSDLRPGGFKELTFRQAKDIHDMQLQDKARTVFDN